jgi:hypothetical protein
LSQEIGSGENENDCFLAFPVNSVFRYEFNTQLTISKTQNNAEDLGIHTGNHDLDMKLIADVTNHGVDQSGVYHFRLEIVDGYVSNPDGWKHFGLPSEVDNEVRRSSLAAPFC